MTGMDVLRRCRNYDKDMERLRLRRAMMLDAVTRVTRSPTTSGHGGGADKMGAYAARADALELAMEIRARMYEMELSEATRLASTIEPAQGSAIYLKMVRGMTVRQVAATLHASEDSVRGLQRRAADALNGMTVEMGPDYEAMQGEYEDLTDTKREPRN